MGRLFGTAEYFEYFKLDNRFCYPILVEICKFLIIIIFNLLSMFVCIMYFYSIYSKKDKPMLQEFIDKGTYIRLKRRMSKVALMEN